MASSTHNDILIGQDTLVDAQPSQSGTGTHFFYITLGSEQVSCIEFEYFKKPTITTLEAMKEASEKNDLKRFNTVEDFFNDLND